MEDKKKQVKKKPLTLGEYGKNPGRDRTVPTSVRESLRVLYAMKFKVVTKEYNELTFYTDENKDGE